MKLYGAIDLHSNNNVTVLMDEKDKVVYQKRLTNDLPLILEQLSPYASSIEGIVVESTYNWYWLVDGLMEKGHRVHLANTAAIQQYEGLKYTDDDSDARWLAHLFRLGVLPEGYIYPKEERAVRDLLRKRSQLVRQKTANLLSIQNLYSRNTGSSIPSASSCKETFDEPGAADPATARCGSRLRGTTRNSRSSTSPLPRLLSRFRRICGASASNCRCQTASSTSTTSRVRTMRMARAWPAIFFPTAEAQALRARSSELIVSAGRGSVRSSVLARCMAAGSNIVSRGSGPVSAARHGALSGVFAAAGAPARRR